MEFHGTLTSVRHSEKQTKNYEKGKREIKKMFRVRGERGKE